MNRKELRKILLYKRLTAIALVGCILIFLAVFFAFIPFRLLLPVYKVPIRGEGELRLHFLDLEGGVTIVEFSDGRALVVNAGGGDYNDDNVLCRYLRTLNPTAVSLVAVNPDPEHVGGMPSLLETFRVDTVYLPAFGTETGEWKRFVSAVKRAGCETQKISRYDVITDDVGAYAVCLSPYSQEAEFGYDASAVFYLSYAGVGVVLAGDVSAKRAETLVEEQRLYPEIFDSGGYRVRLGETQILYASCHNASSCTSKEWLSLLSPALCVLGCNENESPNKAVLENLSVYCENVRRTDELGTTMITIKDGNYTITSHVIKK